MTECKQQSLSFQAGRREVVAAFDGGSLSSDAGALLLREVERRTGILERFARCFRDHRDPDRIEHPLPQLLAQRVFGIALGYEDLNDHDELRKDPLFAVVAGSDDPEGRHRARRRDGGSALAGKSTLSRLELSRPDSASESRYNRIAAEELEIDSMMVGVFTNSHAEAPREIVLDLDTTDDPVHGQQEGRFFHAYYGHYCFVPLYVFCGEHLLLSRLLPGNADAREAVLPELARIVRQIRWVWPEVRIIVRGDSGFCSDKVLSFCELHGLDYALGMAKNSRLLKKIERAMRKAERGFRRTGEAARVFRSISYRTRRSWSRSRRVVAKAEHMALGSNPRFVVTSIQGAEGDAQWVYEELYCKRGDMENRIKEQQLDMFSDRTSAASLMGNQLRLYFSGVAYMLVHGLRRLGLQGTELARAQCGTIRTKLLKVAARVRVTARKVWISMPTAYPYADLFRRVRLNLLRC